MLKVHHCLLVALVAFVIGALYPAPVAFVKAKITGA